MMTIVKIMNDVESGSIELKLNDNNNNNNNKIIIVIKMIN